MDDDKTANLDKDSGSDNKNSETKTIIYRESIGSKIFKGVLIVAVVFMGLMLAKRQGCIGKPTPIDTTKLVIPVMFDIDVKPDRLPKKTGVAYPTVDTTFYIKPVPLTEWKVYLAKYLNDALSIVAVKPQIEGDSVWHEVWSGTYYAPGGFQMIVDDSIHVDTFPHYEPPQLPKEKVWHWKASLGFCWIAYDTSFTTFTIPSVRVGGELGPLRLGRTSISLTPVQVLWISGGKSNNGVLAAGAEIEVKF